MGQIETAQSNSWFLIDGHGDMAVRVRPGMPLGETTEGELSFEESFAQLELDIADDGQLVVRAVDDHELESAGGDRKLRTCLARDHRVEIHLLHNVVRLDTNIVNNAPLEETVAIRTVRSGESITTPQIAPDSETTSEYPGEPTFVVLDAADEAQDAADIVLDAADEVQDPADVVLDAADEVQDPADVVLDAADEVQDPAEPASSLERPEYEPIEGVSPYGKLLEAVQAQKALSAAPAPADALEDFGNEISPEAHTKKQSKPLLNPALAMLIGLVGVSVVAMFMLLGDEPPPESLPVSDAGQVPQTIPMAAPASITEKSAEETEAPASAFDNLSDVEMPPDSAAAPGIAAVDNTTSTSQSVEFAREPEQTVETVQTSVANADRPEDSITATTPEPLEQPDSVVQPAPETRTVIEPENAGTVIEEPFEPLPAPTVAEAPATIDQPAIEPSAQSRSTPVQPVEPALEAAATPAAIEADQPRVPVVARQQPSAETGGRLAPSRRILLSADTALSQGRLTAPPGSNAYELYNRVLELEPDSKEASKGLQTIRQRLINQALAQLATGALEEAGDSLQAAADAGANPMMVADLNREVNYRQRLADAEAGQFDTLYPVDQLVAIDQKPPRLDRDQASVEVRFTVTTDGNVIDLEILNTTSTDAERELRSALSEWRFEPFLYNGRPVPVRSSVIFNAAN
jgi:TonB family protein